MKTRILVLVLVVGAIVAQQFQDVTELGKPFRFEVASADQWLYYKLNIDALLSGMATTDSVSFIVTPYAGDVDLYISASRFPARRDCDDCWKSTSPHGDIISIARSDPRWPTAPNSFFYIGVYSVSRSRFTFNTFLKSTHVKLLDGEAQSALCSASKVTYFEFHLDDDSDFSVAASPVSGDPDVVVSIDTREPNSTLYDWKADRWGFDIVSIEKTSPKFRANSTYNIGIYAFPDSMFTIAATKTLSYTTIVEGVPLTQVVARKQYKYFKFFMEENNFDLVVTVTALSSSGDPDLYITYNRERPNATNYDYRANVAGSDSIFIREAKSGIYYVAVFGFHESDFQVVANTEFKSILLTEGIPWRGFIEGQRYGFFKFFHGDYESGLSISMNMINGDADMYISTKNTRPTAEAGKHEYVGTKISNNLFWYLPPVDYEGSSKHVYLGVFAKTNVSYSIVAQTNQSYSVLRDSELNYWNHVTKGYYRYFVYDLVDPTQDISISVNPWDGETSLFVSVTNTRPSSGNYTWGSMRYKQDTVVITANDAKKQGKTRFYISVYGNMDSHFSIVAFMSNSSTIILSDGVPIAGGVVAEKYNFYKYWVNTMSSLTIMMELQNPSSTDADIYVSYTNSKPSQLDYQYKGEKYGNDFVRIQVAYVGWIYIGVHGFRATTSNGTIQYTISASMGSQIVSTNRADLLAFAQGNQFKLFHSYIPNNCEFVVLSTTTVYGRTDLYVSSNETGLSMSNYLASSNTHPSNLIHIKKSNPQYKEGFWSMGVHALQDSDFFISATCGGPNNYVWLQEGIPKLSLVPTSGTLMFLFSVDWLSPASQNMGNYLVSIRPLRGTLFLEMYNLFDRNGPRWNTTGSAYHEFKLEKGTVRTGVYVVTIKGTMHREFDTIFELNLRRDGTPVLLNRDSMHIQTNSPSADSFTYYRVLNSFTNKYPLYAFVESCSTEDAPVVYCDPKNPKPDQNAPYKSTAIHHYVQELVVPNTTDTRDVSMWNLGIKGNNYAVYSTIMADSRPHVARRNIVGQDIDKEHLRLTISRAKAPGGWADSNITYSVYTLPLPNGPPNGRYNFFTSCSLIVSGRKHPALIRSTELDSDKIDLEVVFPPTFDKSIGYLINVMAVNGLGLSRPYFPGFYVYGAVWESWPGVSFSIGFILIFICLVLASLYLLVGSIINLIRGKRGVEVIPNYGFWRQLPFLVWEGITAVFCCKLCKPRGSESHTQLVDEDNTSTINNNETIVASASGSDSATKSADEHVEISLAPRGGYGSI